MQKLKTESDAIEYWDKRFDNSGNVGWGSVKSRSWYKQKQEAIKFVLGKVDNPSISDICCGDMKFISEINGFKDESFHYTGIEPTKSIYDQIKKEFPLKDICNERISKLILTPIDKRYNIVICFDFLFHIIEDELYANFLKWVFDSNIEYVVMSYANVKKKEVKSERGHYIPRNFEAFTKSILYWWHVAYSVACSDRDDLKLTIFEARKRPISDIETYSELKNYYFSERLNMGRFMVHELEAIEFIKKACPDVGVVVELGSFHGGFTLQLADTFQNLTINTFDFFIANGMITLIEYMESGLQSSNPVNIRFYQEDVLYSANKKLIGLLNTDKKIFLYCDNGNKPKEVSMYARYLKKGDVIGVHDWDVEIKPYQVEKPLKEFKPIYHDEMKNLLTRLWERN